MTPAINYFDFEKRLALTDNANRTELTNTFTWGASVIKIGDTYHAYIERWDNVDGIAGFAYYGKIMYGSSANRLGPFTSLVELTEFTSQTWSAGSVFNAVPIVIGNTIYMYWCGTTAETPAYPIAGQPARNNMRIGVATTSINTPEGPFTMYAGNPIISPRASEWDERFITNPFPYIAKDGSLKMVYKSELIAEVGQTNIGIAESTDPFTWTNAAAPIAGIDFIEESGVWREGDIYFMISKDLDSGSDFYNEGILLYSKTGNADDWHLVTQNTRAFRLALKYTTFASELRPRIERPFVLVEDGVAVAFFTAVSNAGITASFNIGRDII
jgi:hypothetical protein